MSRLPQLPKNISDEMDEILQKSRESYQEDDIETALQFAHEAWGLIPEPKEKWDYYPQSLSAAFVEDYTDLKNVNETKKWIKIAYKMFNDPDRTSHYILSVEARSLYKLDLLDVSYDVFDRIFELYGREGFQGENMDYSEFYFTERAKRQD